MVSEVRYYSFKEIRFHHRHPFPVLLRLILAHHAHHRRCREVMLFLGITGYALSGPVTALVRRIAGKPRAGTPGASQEQPPVRAVILDKPVPRR